MIKPPGPATYKLERSEVKLCRTLPFDGLKQYSNPMKAAAPDLRAMRNFGHGCSYDEHVLYGQCLDGKCSTRAPWEKFNMKKIKHWRNRRGGAEIKGEEFKDREKTAVHFAVMYSDLNLVDKLLKENGLDVDALDEKGQTPLHIACEKGLSRITERLLNNEQHPLTMKIGFVSKRIAPLIDVQDKNGHTPLHLAAVGSHRKCCELLIDAGTNPDILNLKKQTALDVSGTQALFQQLEYYSEMSKERARTEALTMKRNSQMRRYNEYVRTQERGAYKKEMGKQRMMTAEMNSIHERGKTLMQKEKDMFGF